MPKYTRGLVFSLLFALGLLSLLLNRGLLTFLHLDMPPARKCNTCWQRLVFSQQTNSFELSLVTQVSTSNNGSNMSSDKWISSDEFMRIYSELQPFTFEQMAKVPDEIWKRPVPRSVYMLYPQALDVKQVVANITQCLPIPEAPIFNRTIRFFNVNSTVCVPEKSATRPLDAIVMVKSGVYNFEDRERIRRAYASSEADIRIAIIFSVGLPRSSGGRFFQRDGFNISLPDRAGESIEKMQSQRSDVLIKVAEEAQTKGDLVLGDYEDTYYNLSLKLFYTFQWASSFCSCYFTPHQQKRPPVFILLDDDYAFNASILKAELRNLSAVEIRRITWGIPYNVTRVFRNPLTQIYGKWALSKREVPWPRHAPYAPSIFLVFGADVLQEIALAMYFTRQIPVDDAWLGIIMTKLDLYFQRRPHMYRYPPKKAPKEVVLSAPYEYLFGSK